MGIFGKVADSVTRKVDNFLFNTDRVNQVRSKMTDPNFVSFLSAAERHKHFDAESLKKPENNKKLVELYAAFERKDNVVHRTKEILKGKIFTELGIEEDKLDQAALASIDAYFEETTFKDPAQVERYAKAFEKGEKLEVRAEQCRRDIEALVTGFGAEKFKLMKMHESWGKDPKGKGGEKMREWAAEEARAREYGPLRTWWFKKFVASGVLREKVLEGDDQTWGEKRKLFTQIVKAEKGMTKLDAAYNKEVLGGILQNAELVRGVLGSAHAALFSQMRDVLSRPSLNLEQIVEQRAQMEKFATSVVGLNKSESVTESGSPVTKEALRDFFAQGISTYLDRNLQKLLDSLQTQDIAFDVLRKKFAKRIEILIKDGLETPAQARKLIAQIISSKDLSGLSKEKQIMIGMILNDLTR